ncbi:MAG: hypothetical protein HFH08_04245 [Bacilli bacterium]|nr:hypothetical protein [Bacilli bacterium]
MSNDLLSNMKNEREALVSKLSELDKKQKFYEKCQVFNFDGSVGEAIMSLINKVEDDKFIFFKFSLKEEDKYETRYRSPYEGMYGVSGAELRASAVPYEEFVEGASIEMPVIMDKDACDIFCTLTFSKCKDLKESLAKYLVGRRHIAINQNCNISANDFVSDFTYVIEFLNMLSNWRFENNTLDIPVETLSELSQQFIGSDGSKLQKSKK